MSTVVAIPKEDLLDLRVAVLAQAVVNIELLNPGSKLLLHFDPFRLRHGVEVCPHDNDRGLWGTPLDVFKPHLEALYASFSILDVPD